MTFDWLVFALRVTCVLCALSAVAVLLCALYACLWLYWDQLFGLWGGATAVVLIALATYIDSVVAQCR